MSDSGAEPNINRVMDIIERQAKLIRPPLYWTEVRFAGWPSWIVDPTDEASINQLLSEQDHSMLFWGDSVSGQFFREENTAELSPGFNLMVAYVIKGSNDLQREMGAATEDLINFFRSNPEWNDPDYDGPNTWGDDTMFPADGSRIQWYFPKVNGQYGSGIVWGIAEVGVRFPWPKG